MTEMDVRLVGLSGYAGVGKDAVGEVLCADYGFERVAFADKLKAVAEAINPRVPCVSYDPACTVPLRNLLDKVGWDGAKKHHPAVREMLQRLGVACRDHIHPDVWCRALLDGLDPDKRYVITDVRFPNEYDLINNLGGQVWRVERPGVGPANSHGSETAIDGAEFSRVLLNDGTLQDLRHTVLNSLDSSAAAV